jgi:hypothetical protein
MSLDPRRLGAVGTIALFIAVLSITAAPIAATAAVYPASGGTFGSDDEGWQATEASCNLSLGGLCTASGSYDALEGNPPGSLAFETSVTLNLGGLFESIVVFESPDFTVAGGGAATMRVDRQFTPGGLLNLEPESTYTVSLIDRGTETPTEVLSEVLDEGDAAFAGREAAASVTAGHTYAISIEADTGSTTTGFGLLGSAVARFDNVALSVQEAAGGGGGGGGGSGGDGGSPGGGGGANSTLSSDDLRTLVRRGAAASATIRGKRVFIRVRCPRRAQKPCRITAQGRIKGRVRVTRSHTVRVARGRSRIVALRVKPRFRETVSRRKRLLVVQKVRVGDVSTTFARSRALIQRR